MPDALQRINAALDRPLRGSSRGLVLAAALVLIPTFIVPLWHMHFVAQQYPEGLELYVYSHDLVGGDFFAIRQLNADQYGFVVADVMGHGIAAALHTMHLSSLWGRSCHLLTSPARFAETVNNELEKVVKDESFATAICGVIDANDRTIRFTAAGGPPVVVFRAGGSVDQLESPGFPFGMMADS